MDQITRAAKAAYESIEGGSTAKHTPWDCLSAHWQDYWRVVAKAVISALSKVAA